MKTFMSLSRKKKLSKSEIDKKVANILREARREPRFRKAQERDALIESIRYGYSDVARELLNQGVDPDSTDPKGRSALWHAAYWTRSDVIRDLVKKGAKLPDDVLMGPVHEGDVETVRLLIRHGANVNCVASYTRYSYKFPKKEVLLTVAIEKILSLAIASGAARGIRAAMTKTWRANHSPVPPNEDWELIPVMLIKAGAEVNRLACEYSLYDGFIRTILGLAALKGHTRVVRAMLAAGADVNQCDTWGGTALFDAAQEGHEKIVKILLAAGAKANLKRRDGATPVSIARDRGFTELANAIERHMS